MHSYLFVFSFGQSKGKADKLSCIINMLDVLRESSIRGGVGAFARFFMKSHSLAPNHLIDWGVKETKFDKKRGSLKLIDNLIGQYNRT